MKHREPSLRGIAKWILGFGPALAALLIFSCCLTYIVVTFDWGRVRSALGAPALLKLLLFLPILIICYWAARAWRWQLLLRTLQHKFPFWDVYYCTVISTSIANYSPFQSGEALKIEMLRRNACMDKTEGYASFLVERLMDLAVILVLATVAAGSLFGPVFRAHVLILLGTVTILAWICLVFLRKRLLAGGLPAALFRGGMASLRSWRDVCGLTLLTVLSWGLIGSMWRLCLQAIGVRLSLTQALHLVSLSTLSGLLSLVPGGLGVVEITNSKLLVIMGNSLAQSQTGAIAIRIIGLEMLIMALAHMAINRIVKGMRRAEAGLVPSGELPKAPSSNMAAL